MTSERSGDPEPAKTRPSAEPAVELAARELAATFLRDRYGSDDYVITGAVEYDVGWVFFWNSARYTESGDFRHALGGNAPILVDRTDWSVHLTGTGRPTDEYIERYRARDPRDERSWHP